ncbi:hypothetical protein Plhal304r1_c017g0063111 [Plasmopara halstedii]
MTTAPIGVVVAKNKFAKLKKLWLAISQVYTNMLLFFVLRAKLRSAVVYFQKQCYVRDRRDNIPKGKNIATSGLPHAMCSSEFDLLHILEHLSVKSS